MDDQFRDDQERQREQQAHMHVDVVEERQRDTPAPGVPFDDRQQQQRHPGEQRQDDDAAAQQIQRVPGQTRPPPELIQRPAEDQREVGRLLQERFVRRGTWCAHVASGACCSVLILRW